MHNDLGMADSEQRRIGAGEITMTVSPPACTVFINGSYIGNCSTNPTLRSFFGTSPIVMDIFYGLIVAWAAVAVVVVVLLLTMRRKTKVKVEP